jgi:hypothetical protein
MRRIFLVAILATLPVIANAQGSAPHSRVAREKLGLRLGYVKSGSDIEKTFGDGMVVAVHFTERVKPPLFIDITLGAFYLGDAANEDITRSLFGPGVSGTSMRIIHFLAAPTIEFPITRRLLGYVSPGIGFYNASVLLDLGLIMSDISDSYFGASGTAGIYWGLSDRWNLDFNFTAHHIWTPEKQSDIFFLYSEGDSDPAFFQFCVGVTGELN